MPSFSVLWRLIHPQQRFQSRVNENQKENHCWDFSCVGVYSYVKGRLVLLISTRLTNSPLRRCKNLHAHCKSLKTAPTEPLRKVVPSEEETEMSKGFISVATSHAGHGGHNDNVAWCNCLPTFSGLRHNVRQAPVSSRCTAVSSGRIQIGCDCKLLVSGFAQFLPTTSPVPVTTLRTKSAQSWADMS